MPQGECVAREGIDFFLTQKRPVVCSTLGPLLVGFSRWVAHRAMGAVVVTGHEMAPSCALFGFGAAIEEANSRA